MARQSLVAIIGADARQFNRTMRKVKRTAGNIGRGLAAAGAAGATALAGATVKAVNFGDEIDKMSKRTGFTAETLQKFSFAAELSGASASDVEKSIKRLATNLLDAGRGLKDPVDSLKALGVEFEDIKDKSPDKQLVTVLKALSGVENASRRAALAQKLLGRSGTALLPIISDGADGFDELFGKLGSIGGVISNEGVAAAASLKDAFTELVAVVRGIAFSTILDEAGTLQEGVDGVTESIIAFRQSSDFAQVSENFKSILELTGFIAKSILAIIGGLTGVGSFLNDNLVQPLDRFTDKLAELANNKLFGKLTKGQQLESAVTLEEARATLGARPRTETAEAGTIGAALRGPRVALAASQDSSDILRRLEQVMIMNAESNGVVAGAVATPGV